jgi:1-acyl-sn-glycerol-3-phosphate acyltransferase
MRITKGILGLFWKLYIAFVFSIFAIFFYPFFLILLLNSNWKKYSFNLFLFWSWLMLIFFFYGVKKVKNSELPEGHYIIIANHSSYLDIFLMYSILPKHRFVFLGKSEILSYPIISTYFKNLNIPVFRTDKSKAGQSYNLAAKAVQDGWSIVIFPEGGIPDNQCPKMIPFKDGAFKLAKTLKVPIVPLAFTNNYKLFSDPTEILGPARPGIAKVYIHEYLSLELIQSKEIKEINKICFDRINESILFEHPNLRD